MLAACLLSKNVKIMIYKFEMLSVVLHGCETWPITLKEEHRMKSVSEKRCKREAGEISSLFCNLKILSPSSFLRFCV
jgi:hypothetical protein